MPFINEIPVSKTKVIPSISDAEPGMLLQISMHGLNLSDDEGPSVTCMFCDMQVAGGLTRGVVLLEGSRAGTFLTTHELENRAAIDISELSEIALDQPSPIHATAHPLVAGDVCHARDGNDRDELLCMVVRLSGNRPDIVGYLPLSGAQRGRITQVVRQFYIGRARIAPLSVEGDMS